MSSDNHGLASAMSTYLRRQLCSAGIVTRVLEGIVKKHFSNQVRESRRSAKSTKRKNTATRRRQHDVALLHQCGLTYKENKNAIDKFMDKVDCAHAIQKATMSDKESDDKNSLQKLFTSLDKYSTLKTKKRTARKITRVWAMCDAAVPTNLKVPLAQ
ncbi:hypothetical protein F4703DRAFT_1796778 [Phycomyces blakesleeanus]